MDYLLWFKNDLRLDDNPALLACLDGHSLLPVYLFDPDDLEPGPTGCRRLGVHRARLILESLAALDTELRRRGSGLLVLHGRAEECLPALAERLGVQQLVTSEEADPLWRERIAAVRRRLGTVLLRETPGNGLYPPLAELPRPLRFARFRAALADQPPLPVREAPSELPPLPKAAEALLTPLPTPSQLGIGEAMALPHSAFPFTGGEPAALSRLRDYLRDSLADYREQRLLLSGSAQASRLSPYLASGCLSVRRLLAELQRHELHNGSDPSSRALRDALLWREFFRQPLLRYGAALFPPEGATAEPDEGFTAWCVGRTGWPLVDACMRELAASGFLSLRGRQLVAGYLVGVLGLDWRLGAAWFEEHLIDHEKASNWGNWQLLAARCAEDPNYRRRLHPMMLFRELDPHALYVSLWLPELQRVPENLRHTPFLYDPSGNHYPLPLEGPVLEPYRTGAAAA